MTKRLHVVSVCRTLPTPDDPAEGIFVLNRLRAMAALADLTVVQPVPYFPGLRPLPSWASEHSHTAGGVQILHAPMLYVPGVLKSWDARWLARSVKPMIARLHAERPIDVIDAHFGYPDGAGCESVGRDLGIPVCITIRGFENEVIARQGVGPQLVHALRASSVVIAVSHSLRELALGHGVADSNLAVIHNAVDWSVFHAGSWDEARARVGVDPTSKLVLSVGHLIERKRHHVLVKAFAPLARQDRSLRLVIIGGSTHEPGYRAKLDQVIRSEGLVDRVTLAGNRPPREVADWLRAADLFALGTAREGCCNAVLEALACGVPVVTTPVGDNAHFVQAGVNGDLVPVDDVDATSRALADALAPARWDRAAIAAEFKANVGTWENVGARAIEFIGARLSQPAVAH